MTLTSALFIYFWFAHHALGAGLHAKDWSCTFLVRAATTVRIDGIDRTLCLCVFVSVAVCSFASLPLCLCVHSVNRHSKLLKHLTLLLDIHFLQFVLSSLYPDRACGGTDLDS